MISIHRKALCIAALLLQAVISTAQAEAVIYSQTSLAGSGATTPGLFDQLGLNGGSGSERRDEYVVFANDSGLSVLINKAIIFGAIFTPVQAVFAPVVEGTVLGLPPEVNHILVPDRKQGNLLATTTVPVSSIQSGAKCATSTFGYTACEIAIPLLPGIIVPAGGKLAFGLIAPLEKVNDAWWWGSDLPEPGLSSTNPPYWNGFYATFSPSPGVDLWGIGLGHPYLVVSGEPLGAPCDGPWKNHGEYVSTVARTVNELLAAGKITQEERDLLINSAAQSTCGKK